MRIWVILTLTTGLFAQSEFEGRPAVVLRNELMQVTVLPFGATIASITLRDDKDALNPLWNPKRADSGMGHFVCVDGFGPTSKEEREAGLPGHGEAVRQSFEIKSRSEKELTLTGKLPLVEELFTRTFRMIADEPVLYVKSTVQSLLGFDRPMSWAEHATIGSPFLEAGVTAVDFPALQSKTRPYTDRGRGTPHRLASEKDFAWPMAPLIDGTLVDIRKAPAKLGSGDHTTSLLDSSRQYAFVTAMHPGKRLMVGWVFRASDFPWLQNWESYPAEGGLARGLEFSTQPFDVSRKDAVGMSPMFGTPTFRWLPAKSSIETNFLVFYTRIPEGFSRVSEVRWNAGTIEVEDAVSGKKFSVRASLGI